MSGESNERKYSPMTVKIFYTLVLSFLLTVCIMANHADAAPPVPRILVINSYNIGYDWSDDEFSGVKNKLNSHFARTEVYSEYLDTKKFFKKKHFPQLAQLLAAKYHDMSFDVIIAMDNSAFEFVLAYRDKLFPKTPIVFCGINDYDPAMIAGQRNITGVAEYHDSVGTIELALSIHPNVKEVIVLHDYTDTGLAMRREVEKSSDRFSKIKLRFVEEMPIEQLVKQLSQLPSEDIILMQSYTIEKSGRTYTQAEIAKTISSASSVPVYSVHAAQLGNGVIGGRMMAGSIQGEKAAELVLQILDGAAADDLKVITGNLATPQFDYRAMKKYGIPESKIPVGSVVINRPNNSYPVNKSIFWLEALFTLLTTTGVIILYINIQKRKRLEKTLLQNEEELHLQTKELESEIAIRQESQEDLLIERNNLMAIFDSAPVGMLLIDKKCGILNANKLTTRIASMAIKEMLGRSMGQIFDCKFSNSQDERCGEHPGCQNCLLKTAIRKGFDGIASHGIEAQHFLKFGTKEEGGWIRFSVEPVELNGRIQVLLACDDISISKAMEEQIQQDSKRLNLIFETSRAGLILLDLEGHIAYANRRMGEMFNMTQAELMGKPYTELVHESEFSIGKNSLERILACEVDTVSSERHYRRRDGTDFWGHITAKHLLNEDGSLKALVTSITDISDIKEAVENLKTEKERLAVTLRSIGDGVITTDVAGNVVLLNAVAENLCGWTQEESSGKQLNSIFKLVSIHNKHPLDNPVKEVLATRRIVEMASHCMLIARNGSERIIADSAAPILNESGKLLGVVLVFRDVTEKTRVEDELFKTRKLDSIGILAGGIAHDFNNYLTAILGNISLAQKQPTLDARAKTLLERAEVASNRARELTQQLLAFSKGGAPVRKLASIAQLLVDSANFAVRGANVRCDFDIEEHLFPVEIDSGQISQVISNLVINANQAMPDGGVIHISACNVGAIDHFNLSHPCVDYVKILVRDEGIGISEEYLDRIFDPYFTTKQQGSGLGLASVYSIIKNHEGFIYVSSMVGVGTTFEINLPAIATAHVEVVPDTEKSISGSGKILILDDDGLILEVLAEILSSLGYDVVGTSDGADTCERYIQAHDEGKPFDVVIVDITIPGGMGGKEVMPHILACDPQARVIVSSGYAHDPIMANYKDYGFVSALAKPYDVSTIGVAIKNVMDFKAPSFDAD